jgi:hypothetical protein
MPKLIVYILKIPLGKIWKLFLKTFIWFFISSWARLELLAGLLQEVLLLSLSLSIIVDAINKLINPNHIEDPSAMIYLGSAGVCIGLLGLFLFRGYDHDHNIGNEIVEQKKIDFVQSVCTTLKNLDTTQPLIKSELNINEISSNINEQRIKRHDLILPSLNDTYTNAFLAADRNQTNDQFLRVPTGLNRMKSKSGESMVSSVSNFNEDKTGLDDGFQETRVYATLHALCLHSLVNID